MNPFKLTAAVAIAACLLTAHADGNLAKKRDARSLAEVETKEISLKNPRDLGLESYNDREETAFMVDHRDECVFTLHPVENFPQTGGYAVPKSEMKWKAGKFKLGAKISDAKDCASLPFMYRSDCRKVTAGLGLYFAPNSIELSSLESHKVLTVYQKKDLSSGVFRCLSNHAFNLPQVELTEPVQMSLGDPTVSR
jgi:hypothetical protein